DCFKDNIIYIRGYSIHSHRVPRLTCGSGGGECELTVFHDPAPVKRYSQQLAFLTVRALPTVRCRSHKLDVRVRHSLSRFRFPRVGMGPMDFQCFTVISHIAPWLYRSPLPADRDIPLTDF